MPREEVTLKHVLENIGSLLPMGVTKLRLSAHLLSEVPVWLPQFCDLQVLFLENNSLVDVHGLEALTGLRSLFLAGNKLPSIDASIRALRHLTVLDVRNNRLKTLAGVGDLPHLAVLHAAQNQLQATASLSDLPLCTHLHELDVSDNKLRSRHDVVELLLQCPALENLCLEGNPLCRGVGGARAAQGGTTAYRRATVATMPGLVALDHRAISSTERAFSERWWSEQSDARAREASEHDESAIGVYTPPAVPAGSAARAAAYLASGSSGPLRVAPQTAPRPPVAAARSCVWALGDRDACGAGGAVLHSAAARTSGELAKLPEDDDCGAEVEPPAPASAAEELPGGVLAPLFARLGLRELEACSRTCRWWSHVARPELARRRVEAAGTGFGAAMAALRSAWRDVAETDWGSVAREQGDFTLPPSSLGQVGECLVLLWRRANAVLRAQGFHPDECPDCCDEADGGAADDGGYSSLCGAAGKGAGGVDSGDFSAQSGEHSPRDVDSDGWSLPGDSPAASPSRAVGDSAATAVVAPPRRAPAAWLALHGGGGACYADLSDPPGQGLTDPRMVEEAQRRLVRAAADAAPAVLPPATEHALNLEELRDALRSSTLRRQAWQAATDVVLSDERFPWLLPWALPLPRSQLTALECAMGVDSHEGVYIKEADSAEAARCLPAAGLLCDMIVAVIEAEGAREALRVAVEFHSQAMELQAASLNRLVAGDVP
ncbi:unnamed protein product [Pedinophyceae sp. YPF-701]|nr:unnamed protein product [Pedinophyceae sp. YPF-701]